MGLLAPLSATPACASFVEAVTTIVIPVVLTDPGAAGDALCGLVRGLSLRYRDVATYARRRGCPDTLRMY